MLYKKFKAVKWCRKAAEQGDAQAQYNLGLCYDKGEGVPRNLTEAVGWFRKAAKQGLAQAQFYLGCCYATGSDVPKDLSEAAKWFRRATDNGNTREKEILLQRSDQK